MLKSIDVGTMQFRVSMEKGDGLVLRERGFVIVLADD